MEDEGCGQPAGLSAAGHPVWEGVGPRAGERLVAADEQTQASSSGGRTAVTD